MALTESKMLALGSILPDFDLIDTVSQQPVTHSQFAGRPLLVMFICNHCPFVKHVQAELAKLGQDYRNSPLGIVAIQSNDVKQYPDDAPDKMQAEARQAGYGFPYLYDETQEVARRFSAACTPDFFLFDPSHRLAYRGRLDETRPRRMDSGVYDFQHSPAHGADLRKAIDAVLAGRSPSDQQFPSMGCNIKWRTP
jgi:thiol-disulfide isomerase/thioredoxin